MLKQGGALESTFFTSSTIETPVSPHPVSHVLYLNNLSIMSEAIVCLYTRRSHAAICLTSSISLTKTRGNIWHIMKFYCFYKTYVFLSVSYWHHLISYLCVHRQSFTEPGVMRKKLAGETTSSHHPPVKYS